MSDLVKKYGITSRELARGRNLLGGAIGAPIVAGVVPAAATAVLMALFGSAPPVAVTILFFGMVVTIVSLLIGLGLSGMFMYRRSNWKNYIREKIAASGIGATEVDWFRREMKPSERKMLDGMRKADPLVGDSYAEALASRITAKRIQRSSKRELLLMQRRRNKLQQLKAESAERFIAEIDSDIQKVTAINDDASATLAEAESRMQMVEAAYTRGSSLSDNEIALKKLNARAAQLPLALEQARLTEEIRRELELEEGE